MPADRGTILDRNGAPLAESVDASDVIGDPLVASSSTTTSPTDIADKLAPLLGDQKSLLAAKLTGSSQFVYLARAVTPQIANAIQALKLPGVTMEATKKRVYPANNVAANVLGFVGSDGKGLGGLEYQYQKVARG